MKKIGIGYACSFQGVNYHFGHPDSSSVELCVSENNHIIARTAASDIGQGLESMIIAVISIQFGGFPPEKIHWEGSNTSSPDAGGTGASRQSTLTGNATFNACERLKVLLRSVASEYLDVDPDLIIFDGDIVRASERFVGIEEIFDEARNAGLSLAVTGKFEAPLTTSLDEDGKAELPISQFGYAVQVVEVEVDTITGEVVIKRVRAFHDAGNILNHVGATGQVEGGVVMGMGFALSEDYLTSQGRPVNVGFTNYIIPSIADSPRIDVDFLDIPSPIGSLGVKGLAEIPTSTVAPAIINAIQDAIGVRITHIPATPERVLDALNGKNK